MGLLEQEIQELRSMNKQLMSGKLSPEAVHARIAIYSQTEKRAKMMLQALSLGAKHGAKTLKMIEDSNIAGNGTHIDMGGDSEIEQIKCPAVEKIITRSECLDYSGETKHHETCKDCEQFGITRHLLLTG